jgi:peptidoglycan hydrolase-like protein with peptidoglycan-binding domain
MLYLGDFNGDKHQDVIALDVAADGSLLPELFLGRGDDTFQDPIAVTNVNFPNAYPYQGTIVADIDGDGRDDLLNVTTDVSSGTSTVNALLSKGDGTLEPITTPLPASYGIPASADFNGDGKSDLVMPLQQRVQVLLGKGDGTFDLGSQTLPVPPFDGQPCAFLRNIVTGDFDHDGKADLAVLCLQSSLGYTVGPTGLFVYFGNGDGSFSQPVTAAVLDRR